MYKKAIEKDLQQIFETRRVDFVGVENCIEQDTLCVDISRVRTGAQEGKAWARVYGSVGIRGTIKKNPSGFLTKKIAEAEPEVLKRFWFAPVEMPASTPTEWELKATKLDFVYFYREEYAPVKGILEYAKMFWDMVVNAIPKNPIDPIPDPEPEPEPELPTSNGIDENTVACWHFDETINDEVSGVPANQNAATIVTDYAKFGPGSVNGTVTLSNIARDTKEAFSFDFWALVPVPGISSYAEFYLDITYPTDGKTWLKIVGTAGNKANVSFMGGTNEIVDYIVPKGEWVHWYGHYDPETELNELFANGNRILSKKNTGNVYISKFYLYKTGVCRFDEVRISKCVRWKENFTPPEKPYSA